MLPIPIPQENPNDIWQGTTDVKCHCGGNIVWAEAGYVPGSRACRSCLTLFAVRGKKLERRLHPQGITDEGIIGDISDDDEVYVVTPNLYPNFHEPLDE